ncbi:hypothetical protein RB594_007094 [Gaeumannomyces avenae]
MSHSRAFDFGGEVAIVTGGGCLIKNELGNGSAAAVLLARHGARVAVVDRDVEAAAETKRIIEEEGGVAEVVRADVTLDEDCKAAVSKVVELFGRVDILVNIVGTGYPTGNAETVTTEAFNEGMHYNVTSMVQMVRHAVPVMRAGGKGAIVNMSSVVGLGGGAPGVFYSTSKGAIVAMTRAMAGNYGPDAIRVNCVCPGMAYTPMARVNAGDDGAMSEQMRAERRNLGFLKYEGTVMDIGYAILFLSSKEARWITGAILPIDGGVGFSHHARHIVPDTGTCIAPSADTARGTTNSIQLAGSITPRWVAWRRARAGCTVTSLSCQAWGSLLTVQSSGSAAGICSSTAASPRDIRVLLCTTGHIVVEYHIGSRPLGLLGCAISGHSTNGALLAPPCLTYDTQASEASRITTSPISPTWCVKVKDAPAASTLDISSHISMRLFARHHSP